MNWQGSGFVPIIIYSLVAVGGGESDSFSLITESNLNILTENGNNIDIEH